ncbi:MAG TPA: hypothetical protein VJA82_02115 [Sediminibacterium sp.]|uniref:hypothetical protein n=1 Tax=Sediminibacterium sp. TaxID=1917865 RepID=UPI0008AD0091|nr:hypothetical protein [Sediminibacterium sp.]OHC84133.1 MAG: hypothetical protein A2472_13655 [Sphingobacteriia bacterium RIFOXYC2_FULL_35_18]OHC87820.1 MAG: hypothetical protein A2546_05515 [Sphingobacteriia bacterium RIFOXYD2_FULL_35_12]HLD52075.1 hypothetical protein [Sediminibacterium sp.]
MSEPTKVTYLLGAGASANALPIINELPSRLKEFRFLLFERCDKGYDSFISSEKFQTNIQSIARKIIVEIDWVLEELMHHSTIDTLAKRLYLISSRHQDLIRLKKVLYTYFLFEQGYNDSEIRKGFQKEVPDKRYDSFIATYISSVIDSLKIPGNIKVVTWNYDIQFDIAFSKYLTDSNIDNVSAKVQILPSLSNSDALFDYEKFGILHLNGVINSVFEWQITNDLRDDFDSREIVKTDYLSKLCITFANLNEEKLRFLTYSWEDPQVFPYTIQEKSIIKSTAIEIFKRTDILVIIGYSFPVFNRETDRELMKNLNKNVRHVYIQDTKDKVEDIKNIFVNSFAGDIELPKSKLSRRVSTVNYINQFHVPPEIII